MSRFHVNRAATVVARIVAAVCAVAAVAFAAGSGKTGEQPNTLAGSSGMNALGSGDIIVGGSPTTPPEFSDFMITFDESLAAGTVALGTLDLANVPGNTTLQAASELTLNDDVMFSLPIDVVFEARGLLRAFNHVNGAFALTCNADADGDGTGDLDLRRPVNVSGPATFAGAQVFVDKVWAASITIDDPFAVERDLIATGDIVLNADGFFDGINASFPNQTVDAATLTANGDLFKSTTGDLTIVSVNPAVTAGEVVVATGALLIEAPLVTASARYLSDGNMTVDADVLSLDVTGSSYLESANGMLHVTGTILPGAGSTIAFSAGTSIDLDGEINGIADIEITDPCTLGGNVVVDGFTLEGAATFDGAGDQAVVTGPITTQDEVLKTTPGALRFFGSDVD
ncbi:MAG: hypothetical protein GY715_08060, partial [Planctomycetes bacterium]|nr:hypothetical protein [Planctomycetota bacterium]